MYLIKIKTKRGHCTLDWGPWSHILGNTARSTPHSGPSPDNKETNERCEKWFSSWRGVASPGPAQHTHFLCILTQLPVTGTHQHGDLI